MALSKQSLNINFAKGLDTKTDKFQVSPGNFLALENSVFTKANQLTKRNGFGALTSLPDASNSFLTTFNENLIATGKNLFAYSDGSNRWVESGPIKDVNLSVTSLVRSNTNQTQCDSVTASNGLTCAVFTDNIPTAPNVTTPSYKYVINDSITGQNIIPPTEIPVSVGTIEGAPKVFILGNHFVIVVPVNITATFHLQYVAINTLDPASVSSVVNITSQYDPNGETSFEGVVTNNNLYLAWNGSDGGGAIRTTYIDSTLTLHSVVVDAGYSGTYFSLCADATTSTPNVYILFYDAGSNDGWAMVKDSILTQVLAPTQIINNEQVLNIVSTAQDMSCSFYYEIDNNYGYDAALPTHYIKTNTVSQGGSVGTASVLIRSVGLASKAFLVDEESYFLAAYQSSYQPSYYLLDGNGDIVAKLAYPNGGGYVTSGNLPSVTPFGDVYNISYLIKATLQAVNKSQNAPNASGIYSSLGINISSFEINATKRVAAEIGENLNLSGGFLWAYDGYLPVEQGFFLWPDNVEANELIIIDPLGETTNGSPVIENISDFTGLEVGMNISGTGIPMGATIIAIDEGAGTLTISADATATNIGVSLGISGNMGAQDYFYQVTYEWSDNQGNLFRSAPSLPVEVTISSGSIAKLYIPTLRLTYKTANPVKIVIYRWSTAQQIYYQVTSISVPLLNDTSVDYVTYTDISSDAQIIGNNIIYTTGGVVENIGAPSTSSVGLFKSRVFLIDAENPNQLWFSKQVIPGTPVEMSDLLTYNVAPTTGAQGSTGPNRCLAPLDDKCIVFKSNAIYYFTGTGPDNTGANNDFSEPVFITSTVGCANQRSIVFTPQGLMFQSNKGIWLLGRDLSTQYIGAPVEGLTDGAIVLSAINVPNTNQVRFTLDTGVTLMYDYYFGQWGSFTGVPAISNVAFQDLDTFINSRGEVYQETPNAYLDGATPVRMKFTTGWMNLAGLQGMERAYFFYLLGVYYSPHKLNVQVAYDYNPSPTQTTLITPDNYAKPWGGEQLWGSNGPWGGTESNVEQWRVFLERQKCQSFQITIEEVFDTSFGVPAGAGFTLSGLNLVVGLKKGYYTLKPSRSAG